MIIITNVETGEVLKLEGKLMVAPNGMAFVKKGSETIWCSASTIFEAYKEQ